LAHFGFQFCEALTCGIDCDRMGCPDWALRTM